MKVKFLAILLLIGVSQAQERLVARDQVPDAPSTRRFWSAENKIDLSSRIPVAKRCDDPATFLQQRGGRRGQQPRPGGRDSGDFRARPKLRATANPSV